jgi:hypothetical protein
MLRTLEHMCAELENVLYELSLAALCSSSFIILLVCFESNKSWMRTWHVFSCTALSSCVLSLKERGIHNMLFSLRSCCKQKLKGQTDYVVAFLLFGYCTACLFKEQRKLRTKWHMCLQLCSGLSSCLLLPKLKGYTGRWMVLFLRFC